jgi:hypothetical protein
MIGTVSDNIAELRENFVIDWWDKCAYEEGNARDSCDAVIALCKTCLDGKWPARQADASSCQYHESVHFTE